LAERESWVTMNDMRQRVRNNLILLSIFSGALYLVISILVHQDIFRSFDYSMMVWFQRFFSRVVDIPFSLITLAGSTEIISIILFGIFAWVFFFRKKIFLSICLYFMIFLIEIFGKIFIYHPPPPGNFHRYALNFSMPSGSLIDTSFSYPSGHMARIAFLSIVLLFLVLQSSINNRRKMLLSLSIGSVVLIVFISRIYLGEHWFSDVLGGAFLGGGLATLSFVFW